MFNDLLLLTNIVLQFSNLKVTIFNAILNLIHIIYKGKTAKLKLNLNKYSIN